MSRFHKLRSHQLTKNASWLFLGQALNFLLQVGYFLLLARLLGVTEYGVFAGVFALVNTVAPYSALGAGVLFMRYVSGDRKEAAVYWGNALLTTFVMTAFILGAFLLVGPAITKTHSIVLFLNLGLANCLFAQIILTAGRVFQTFERMRMTATLTLVSNLARFIVLLVMWITMHHATAVQWSFGVLIAASVSSVIVFVLAQRAVGGIAFHPRLIFTRFWEGLGYTASVTSQAVYNDFDKTLLSHYGMNRENGFYTLAYRVIDFAATPVGAIDVAVLPRFFSLSHTGLRPVVKLAVKSVGASMLVGAGIACCTWIVAPIVPHLVGHGFTGVLVAIHWLCIIPLLRGIHTVAGSALTATGNQHIRFSVQILVALLNLGLNIWLIPTHGWIGAAWSSIASDGTLAVLNSCLLFWLWRMALKDGSGSEPAAA